MVKWSHVAEKGKAEAAAPASSLLLAPLPAEPQGRRRQALPIPGGF